MYMHMHMHTCSISLLETQRTTHSRIVYAQAATVRYEMDAATATPLVSWDSFVAYEKVSFPSTTGEVSGLELTSAALLQAQGYTTGFVGKWHLTPPWEDYPEMKRFKKSVSLSDNSVTPHPFCRVSSRGHRWVASSHPLTGGLLRPPLGA